MCINLKKKITSQRFYLASTDVMEFLLQNLLHWILFFESDEHKPPPFVGLWIHWKFNRFNLKT